VREIAANILRGRLTHKNILIFLCIIEKIVCYWMIEEEEDESNRGRAKPDYIQFSEEEIIRI
jgi:hypothetical protein